MAGISIVLSVKSNASADNNGNYSQQITGTSVSINGNPDTSLTLQGTVLSSALLFPTDFADTITITG